MGRRLIFAAAVAAAVAGCDRQPLDASDFDDPRQSTFVPALDVGGGSDWECNPRTQNCPAGEKCMPATSSFNPGALDATRCTPVMASAHAPGEPCTIDGSFGSGVDDCERGAVCWSLDSDSLQGTCISTHTGSASHQICPNPMDIPIEGGSGAFLPCFARCNPLASDCGVGQGCYATTPSRAEFVCMPDAAPDESNAAGDACEFANVCDPGLSCIASDLVPGCDGAGCCSPFCDLDDPDCPAGTDCHPLDPPAVVPGQENVGICRI